MKRNSKHLIRIVECILNSISVMSIDIDVGYPEPFCQQMLYGDNNIVENAEAGGTIRGCMMPSTGVVKGDIHLTLSHQFRCLQSCAHYHGGHLIHPGEDRIVTVVAEIEVGGITYLFATAEASYRCHILLRVESKQRSFVGLIRNNRFGSRFIKCMVSPKQLVGISQPAGVKFLILHHSAHHQPFVVDKSSFPHDMLTIFSSSLLILCQCVPRQ